MSNTIQHLEKKGFSIQMPSPDLLDLYEVIAIEDKFGETTKMYRLKPTPTEEDEILDFTDSWAVYNDRLN